MTELFVAKAIVKLPRRNTISNRQSLIIDTSDYHHVATSAIIKQQQQQQQQQSGDDFLVTDKLYLDGLPTSVTESEIMDLVCGCGPLKIHLSRSHDYASGYIQFINKDMADRAYTLLNGNTSTTTRSGIIKLQLRITSPTASDSLEPEAHAGILHVKNLPSHINNNKSLYELFRPFGPMTLCNIIVEQQGGFKGTALVQYFNSQHAKDAELSMNNKTMQNNIITVYPFVSSKITRSCSSSSSSAASLLYLHRNSTSHLDSKQQQQQEQALQQQQQQQQQQMNNSRYLITSANLNISSSNNNQQNNNQNTTVDNFNNIVDYTNLYIKNLDLNVKSADLFNHFRKYGRIISARVMKNAQTKQSKGFGFVSFSKADEAQKAKQEMNGEYILSKPVIVAFHEPKKSSSSSSPTTKENSTSSPTTATTTNTANTANFAPSFHQHHTPPMPPSSCSSPSPNATINNLFGGDGGVAAAASEQQQLYYHHNNKTSTSDFIDHRYNNTTTVTTQQQKYHQQKNDYSIVSNHIINGSSKSHPHNQTATMERNNSRHSHHPLFDNNSNMQQQQLNHSPTRNYDCQQQVYTKRDLYNGNGSNLQHQQQATTLSTLASGAFISQTLPSSSQLIPNNYYQQQPQQHTPAPTSQSYSTTILPHHQQKQQQQRRPTFRRRGSIESLASVMTETSCQTRRHTITKAVMALEEESKDSPYVNDIVDMLSTLKKKDLATCLFNKGFLKLKVRQAKDALEIFQKDGEEEPQEQNGITYGGGGRCGGSSGGGANTAKIGEANQQQQQQNGNLGAHVSYKKESTVVVAGAEAEQLVPQQTSRYNSITLPPRSNCAIPIVAPPPPVSATAACSSSATAVSTFRTTTVTATTSLTKEALAAVTTQQQRKEQQVGVSSRDVEALLNSFSGKTIHEKKQLLGDMLFPRIKMHGVRHAPRVTIRLLDSVPLEELAYAMCDKNKLKTLIDQAVASMSASASTTVSSPH